MTFRKSLLLLACLTMIAALVACSSSSKPLAVTLSTVPASLEVAATQSITATIANDPSNAGVSWSCAPAGTCGTFSLDSTQSGTPVTYTAPAAVPASTVVITATSIANSAVSASTAAITITPSPTITVTLSTTPALLYENDTLPITATVANDPANGGVTWSCAPADSCGAFSSATTASGAAVTYTAPASVPASTVVITATSIDNSAISASAPAITIDPPTDIQVTLSTPPPSAIAAGTTATVAATVSNDANSLGVYWSCAPVGACGSFSASTGTYPTFSTTYTAPAIVPSPNTITIIASSITDDAQQATSGLVTITNYAFAAGSYVFSMSGFDANDYSFSASGVFTTADGVTISGGEQDFIDWWNGPLSDTIYGGTIATSPDGTGNLIITLNTEDCWIGPGANYDSDCGGNGVETLVATLASSSKGLIAEYDTWATSHGTLDLQTAIAVPTTCATAPCGYAFVVGGVDSANPPNPLVIGGILTEDGNGTISGTNSIFDANDDYSGTTYQGETFAASTVNQLDGLGRVEFELVPTDTTDFGASINLIGYVVDANHIRLVETGDGFGGITGGTALLQGANTGALGVITGDNFVVGMTGTDPNGPLLTAGLFTESSGSFTGYINYNDFTQATVQTPVQAPGAITSGTYTLDATGRVTIPGITDGVITDNLQLYLDGNGNALAISLDSSDALAGSAYLQSGGPFAAASFSGTYAMSAGGVNPAVADSVKNVVSGVKNNDSPEQLEFDAVGPVVADGVGTFTGPVDLNWFTFLYSDLTVTGTFSAWASTAEDGIFYNPTVADNGISGLDVTSCIVNDACTDDAFVYYFIDPTRIVAIEVDANQLTLGYFLQ